MTPGADNSGVIMPADLSGHDDVPGPGGKSSAQVGAGFALPEAMTGKASPAKAAVGDKPVFAYIGSLPQPQRGFAEAVDALARTSVILKLSKELLTCNDPPGVGLRFCLQNASPDRG
jgi:hypothetical protein